MNRLIDRRNFIKKIVQATVSITFLFNGKLLSTASPQDIIINNPMPDFTMLPASANFVYIYDITYTGQAQSLSISISGNDPLILDVTGTMEKISNTSYKAYISFQSFSTFTTQTVEINIEEQVSVIGGDQLEIPQEYRLGQNYPNPFNEITNIPFYLPKAGMVKLVLFDNRGQRVAVIRYAHYPAGEQRIRFTARGLASGTYFLKMMVDGQIIKSIKLTLLK